MASGSFLIQWVITRLSLELYMMDIGPLSFFLNINATCITHGLFISMTVFTKEIIS